MDIIGRTKERRMLTRMCKKHRYAITLTDTIQTTGKWVPFCCTLGGGVDLRLGKCQSKQLVKFSSIYDLYFLNDNKYLKSFGINRCRYAISKTYGKLTTIKTTHKEPCIKFSKLFGHPKFIFRHFKKNFSKKSKISVISLKLTFAIKKNRFGRKLVLRKNCRFSFEIGALFQLVMLYTDTKKKHTSFLILLMNFNTIGLSKRVVKHIKHIVYEKLGLLVMQNVIAYNIKNNVLKITGNAI
ncbi:hypothetical protein AGLY_003265 [Aphis glycines]|uniref:Uncharacterized protein n=1 Tax=Aphis glycines TaxID=307491 RepID=A0A6G0U2P9_APHGL|nr:hypothetical protein AGLY_003265 [Aphis glycines]